MNSHTPAEPTPPEKLGIGSNSGAIPVPDHAILKSPKADLEDRYTDKLEELARLVTACESVPEEITTDEDSGKAQDIFKKSRVAISGADSAREIEKEPYLSGGKEVDAVFKNKMNLLDAAMKKVKGRVETYLAAKEAKRRAEAEAAAEEARQKARREAVEKAQAEERRIAAEDAGREAAERAREARENKDELEAERLTAESDLAAMKLEKATARRDKSGDEAIGAIEARIEAQRTKVAEAKSKLATKRAEIRAATAKAEEEARKATTARKDEKIAGAAVEQHDRVADRHEKVAAGKAAGLSQTRSDYGSVASLATSWKFEITDFDKLPKEALWPIIDRDAIRVAVGKLVSAGQRDIPGAHVFQDTDARIV